MRAVLCVMAALVLVACDQGTGSKTEPTWNGSIGRLVADGEAPEAFEFIRLDGAGPAQGRMTRISVDAAFSSAATRLETLGQPSRMESLHARLVTIGDIEDDDACWLHFEARAVQPQVELGLGRLMIMMRPTGGGEPWLRHSIYVEPVWGPVDMAFEAPGDFNAGEAEVVFGVGTQLQVVDIADISMRCFDDDNGMLARLPRTPFSYGGRDPAAAWRQTAENQIERYRKGDLRIDVTDANGQPVADAEIHIQMSRHGFTFGALIDSKQLMGVVDEDDQDITASYRRNLEELFNTVSFDHDLRWTSWIKPEERKATEEALNWVRSIGLDLRGHGLVSTGNVDLPDELQEKRNDPDVIREAVRKGITATAGELDGRINAWDLVIRQRDNHDLLDLVGWEELPTWFRLVREAAPDAELAISESGILSGDRMVQLATLVGNLVSDDVPIDHIGVQGQFGTQPPPIQVLSDRLDQLASFDLPLVITAFDMATSDQRLQQDFTRDFLTLAFSHPSVEGFVFRRFWDGKGERSDAGEPMYHRDGTISSIGKVYRDLVLGRWWTDVIAQSNAEGELKSRVFQGDYMVSAKKGSLSAMALLTIGPEGAEVNLTLLPEDESERAL